MVDAKHILARLGDSREAAEQIAFADQIVLNKTELVTEAELREVEARLRRINPLAPVHRACRANVALDQVLGRGGFDLERITALEPGFLAASAHVHDAQCGDHPEGDGAHEHVHDAGISSVSLAAHRPLDAARVSAWLENLVARHGGEILRSKGILDVKGEDRRLVFQSVQRLFEGDFQRPWKPGEERSSRLVFIGRHLDETRLRAGLEACVAPAEA